MPKRSTAASQGMDVDLVPPQQQKVGQGKRRERDEGGEEEGDEGEGGSDVEVRWARRDSQKGVRSADKVARRCSTSTSPSSTLNLKTTTLSSCSSPSSCRGTQRVWIWEA